MRRWARLAVALAAGAVAAEAGWALAASREDAPVEALGPGPVSVVVDIEHSRFLPAELRVVAGTEVRFVVRNGDPINHELIVGPPDVHARHRTGTEAYHPPKPGEISLGPAAQGVTSFVFTDPGTVEMACHLPGHYDFGMRGEIEVVELSRRSPATQAVAGRSLAGARSLAPDEVLR